MLLTTDVDIMARSIYQLKGHPEAGVCGEIT